MKAYAVAAGVLILAQAPLVSAGGKGKPAPRPPVPHFVAEVKRLSAEIDKLSTQQQIQLAKVQARYMAQVAKLNLPGLHAEIARLRHDERSAYAKLVDPKKVEAIRSKYKPEIQALEKNIKALEAEMAPLIRQRNAEMAKIRADYNKQIAKLDPPEDRLERRRARLIAKERGELYKLIDPAKAAKIRAEFQPQIDDLIQRIRAKESLMSSLNARMNEEIAALRALYRARVPKKDSSEDRLEIELVRLLEARRYELENTSDPQMRSDIHAAFDGKIEDVREQIRSREARLASWTQEERDRIGEIRGRYGDEIARIDRPEDRMEARLAGVRDQERAAIRALIYPAKVEAIRAKYRPEIESLTARIQAKEAEMSRLGDAMRAGLAQVESAYRPKIMKLDNPEDKMEYKLVRLKVRERVEIMRLIDRAKVKQIAAKYDPQIAAVVKHLRAKDRELVPIGERAMADVNRIMRDFNGRITGLQHEIHRLLTHGR